MDLVVLGNSTAAIAAIESFRQIDKTSTITLVSKEAWTAPYSRPLIAEYLSGEKTYEEILYRPETFYKEKKISKLDGLEAVSIDSENQVVHLSNGQNISYDRLLIATGSTPTCPNIPGLQREGVYSFWTLNDAQQIANRAKRAETAVVVGAGLVGLSAAHALSTRGLKVVVVELLNQILTQNLDTTAARIVQRYMEKKELIVLTGREIQEIRGDEKGRGVTGVILDDGRQIPSTLVVMCTGVRPAINFLKDSGIRTASGVLVDHYLRTSVPNVYAAGDAAQPYDLVYRENRMVANLGNAREQGRIAGMNLAGVKREYKGGIAMVAMRYFGIPWISIGAISCPRASCHEIVGLHSEKEGIYEKLLIKDGDGTLLGAILVGDITQGGILTNLIKNGTILGTAAEYLAERGQFFAHLRHKLFQSEMEGPPGYVVWRKTIGMEKKYKKKIDEERWRKKELGEA
ncbi:MAG: NAD(P)/FAD-dependent oxidoreductase [Candidatus Heimdallarchaeota archaeon]